MKIRAIERNNPNEWMRLHQLQQDAYRVEAQWLGVDPETFFPVRESLDSLMKTSDDCLAAVKAGSIVGAIYFERQKSSILISKLVVDPRFFRLGIAKALLQACLELHPREEFQVGTGARNLPAIRLYESFRFQIFKRETVEGALEIVKLKRQK
jgi:ribosomal protein S18 acetylase RimI-like enzyme